MRLNDVICGPGRPTQTQLKHRRRRAGALLALALAALILGIVVGAGSGSSPSVRPAAPKIGWYGHLAMLAGAGSHSLDFAQRAQQSKAIDRTLLSEPFVRLGGAQHKVVALTFDDGPSTFTDGILDELTRLKVPGTFFVIGYNLPRFAAQLQREVDLGMTVGDHTESHPNLAQLSARDQRSQIVEAASKIHSLGAPRPRLFRPPYGGFDQTTKAILRRQKMLAVLWSVDSEDYTAPGVDAIVHNVMSQVQPGRIILMHDGGGNRSETIAALGKIVPALRKQGYRFVSVPQLILENPPGGNQEVPPGFDRGAG